MWEARGSQLDKQKYASPIIATPVKEAAAKLDSGPLLEAP
jgi:hypothetical protein